MIPVYEPSITEVEKKYVNEALDSGWISSKGPFLNRFEEAFAAKFGFKHAIAVNNGTAACHLALWANGIGPGDEVIIPNITFVATANAVLYCGATPVITCIDLNLNLDRFDIKKCISDNTKAIMPVHLYGCMADMQGIADFNIPIIEDACEALGAKYNGKYAGSFSKAAAFSFFGNKTLTTGEGGMVVTNDDDVADKIRLGRGQGQTKQYWHPDIGWNYRMTNIQAALGLAQLERWDEIFEAKQQIREWYLKYLDLSNIIDGFFDKDKIQHGAWVNIAYVKDSTTVIEALLTHGIECRPCFYPLTEMDRFKRYMHPSIDYTWSHMVYRHIIVLPSAPNLTEQQVRYICTKITECDK